MNARIELHIYGDVHQFPLRSTDLSAKKNMIERAKREVGVNPSLLYAVYLVIPSKANRIDDK